MELQTSRKYGWDKLGDFMISMSKPKHAEELYLVLLQSIDADDEKEVIVLFEKLDTIKYKNGNWEEASLFFEKQFHIQQNFLASNHPDRTSTYTIIGVLYKWEIIYCARVSPKDSSDKRKVLLANHPDLAISYNNIAGIHRFMHDHATAFSFL